MAENNFEVKAFDTDQYEAGYKAGYCDGRESVLEHAQWIYDGGDEECNSIWHCSACGFQIMTYEDVVGLEHSFCGYCGAIMDGNEG